MMCSTRIRACASLSSFSIIATCRFCCFARLVFFCCSSAKRFCSILRFTLHLFASNLGFEENIFGGVEGVAVVERARRARATMSSEASAAGKATVSARASAANFPSRARGAELSIGEMPEAARA